MIGGGGNPDPFVPGEFYIAGQWMGNHGYTDIAGKTLRSLTLDTSVKNLILVIAGQSLMAAESPTAYTPTNSSKIDNFNIYDGAIYSWSDPPVGSSYLNGSDPGSGPGHIGARIADKFINAGTFDRIIVVPVAIGGTVISLWENGSLSNRLPATMKRLASRGFVSQTNVTVAMIMGIGEQDCFNGTSQSVFATSLSNVLATARLAGTIDRIFLNEETWIQGTTSSAIQAAQASLVDNTIIFAGGNLDSLDATNRLAGNTHLNDTGIANAATLIYNAMHASGSPF